MKCGNCKLWLNKLSGETDKDIKQQYKMMGKVIGACTYDGNFYPRFNDEKCPFIK